MTELLSLKIDSFGFVDGARRSLFIVVLILISIYLNSTPASAQYTDIETSSEDEFSSRDANGVDVTTGKLGVTSPTLNFGDELSFGFVWAGSNWVPNVPTFWVGPDRLSVRYGDKVVSFPLPYSTYFCRDPSTGQPNDAFCGYSGEIQSFYPDKNSKLNCVLFGSVFVSPQCKFTSSEGVVIEFIGPEQLNANAKDRNADFHPFSNNLLKPTSFSHPGYGTIRFSEQQTPENPNAALIKIDHPSGAAIRTSVKYNQRYVSFSLYNYANSTSPIAQITIDTPNANPNSRKSYIRPGSTTQVFTDSEGAFWRYTFDGSGNMTRIVDPTGRSVSLTYDGQGRVKTYTRADGTWTYNYPSNTRTTVTTPDNRTRSYEFERYKGKVRKFTDETNRVWAYDYSAAGVLTLITAPEGNKTQYEYDSSSRLLAVKDIPKVGSGDPILTTSYVYTQGCSALSWCNKPVAVIDASGQRTDFVYDNALGLPIDVLEPAVNGVRRTVRRAYQQRTARILSSTGAVINAPVSRIITVSEKRCREGGMTSGSCDRGATDEIVKAFDYGTATGTDNIFPYGERLVTSDGTLMTCYTYDTFGRKRSETQPAGNVGLQSCPRPTGAGAPTSGGTVAIFSVADASVFEGGSAAFVISLSAAYSSSLSLSYATAAGSAGAGDFSARSGTATIAAGQTSVTILVPTIDDSLLEATETFTLNLSAPTGGATISDAQAVGSIFDNDEFTDPGCGQFICQ
jgi:YD repeat-containing protein